LKKTHQPFHSPFALFEVPISSEYLPLSPHPAHQSTPSLLFRLAKNTKLTTELKMRVSIHPFILSFFIHNYNSPREPVSYVYSDFHKNEYIIIASSFGLLYCMHCKLFELRSCNLHKTLLLESKTDQSVATINLVRRLVSRNPYQSIKSNRTCTDLDNTLFNVMGFKLEYTYEYILWWAVAIYVR
jgi:hypothetical protein